MCLNKKHFIRLTGLLIVYFFGLFLLGIALWTNKFFGDVSVDQAISTIHFDIDGAFSADRTFADRFMTWCVYWPLVISLCASLIHILFFSKKSAGRFVPAVVLIASGAMLAHQYQLGDYLKRKFSPKYAFYDTHYRDLKKVSFDAPHPKSLILIYAESLENSYSDHAIFKEDLLASLNQLKTQAKSFDHYQQMPGTGWTIAGIIATQCGIPLVQTTIFNGNQIGDVLGNYLPGATCLSDVLHEKGYQNIFMGGAPLLFSGKGTFLADHHYEERYGKFKWLEHGYQEKDMREWGLQDDQLFFEAKKRLNELMAKNALFNLTILTDSTHGFEGVLDDTCRSKNGKVFTDVVRCSSNEIADFILYIQKKGWLDRVNVVLLGDHLAMKNTVSDKIETRALDQRTIFNMILSNQSFQKNRESVTEFDWLPTLLRLSGITFSGDQLALGFAAIGELTSVDLSQERKIIARESLSDRAGYEVFLRG